MYLRIDYKSISYHKQKRGKGEKRGKEKEWEESKRGGDWEEGGFGLLHVLHSQIMFHTSGPMRSSKDFID